MVIIDHKLAYDTKCPIMLSTDHKLSELVVLDVHKRIMHDGVKNTIAELRMEFWVSKARNFVKKLLSKCVICHRYNSRPYKYPDVSNLPRDRLRDDIPFSCTGVDYFGPLYYRTVDDESIYKCFVSLFTCASTRGLVLMLVPDASNKSFVDALREFISRIGCPQVMISDNGSNLSNAP